MNSEVKGNFIQCKTPRSIPCVRFHASNESSVTRV